MQNLNEIKWLEDNHERIYWEENNILEKLNNFREYRKISALSFIRGTKHGRSRDVFAVNSYNEYKKHELLTDPSKALSDRALITYYFLNGTDDYFRNDNKSSLKNFMNIKNLIEKNTHYRRLYFHSYLNALNNIAATGMGLLRFEEMQKVLEAMKNISHHAPAQNSGIQLRYYMQLTHLYIYSGRYREAAESIPEIETWLGNNSAHELHKVHHLNLLLNISIINFVNGEYKTCLTCINTILNKETKGIAYDMYGFVRLLNLIVHFELGNHDLLPSITRSTYRYYYKNKRLYKFETLVLDFIRKKLPFIITKDDQIAAFKGLKSGFKKITEDPLEKNAYGYFDFVSWLDSKIEGRSYADSLQRKAAMLSED